MRKSILFVLDNSAFLDLFYYDFFKYFFRCKNNQVLELETLFLILKVNTETWFALNF